MPSYSVATSKDKLSNLIDRVVAGEEVIITRHGKPVAELNMVGTAARAARDRVSAMRRLAVWQKGDAPRPGRAIPYERFSEWLYEEDDA